MNPLKIIQKWWSERKYSSAKKAASQWKREALLSMRELQKARISLEKTRKRYDDEFNRSEAKLQSIRNEFDGELIRIENIIKQTEEVIDKFDHVKEMLENEIEIFKDVIVPGLTLSSEYHRQQYEADIALEVQKQGYFGALNKNKE